MQDVIGLSAAPDSAVLAWAAQEERIVLTHDVSTLVPDAWARVAARLPMPGVFVVRTEASVARVVADLQVIVACSLDGEWEGQVRYLPL